MFRSNVVMAIGIAGLFACGGKDSSAPPANNAPAPSASASSAASPQNSQCHIVADRMDQLDADSKKMDMKTAQGMQDFAGAATAASNDLAAAKLDGDLAAIARDSATYLQAMSKAIGDMAVVMTRLMAAVDGMHPDTVKACVEKPSRTLGTICGKPGAPAECPTVSAALDAWGKSPKADAASAMKAVMDLKVTTPSLKAPLAELARCVKPIASAFDEVDKDKKQLQQLATFDQKPETDLNARFQTTCGRSLFSK
jgi:hypothetical protein